MFTVPVLLIVWRRPDALRQLINVLRQVKPSCLFVACDGPSSERPYETLKVAATQALIKTEIDWHCDVRTLYSAVNQGCCIGPKRAIDWFFEYVDEGIILEDDCIPHVDFFDYCAQLLGRYRSNSRIWCISGNSYLSSFNQIPSSYYFSRYTLTWGWATWKDRWINYDLSLSNWPFLRDSGLLSQLFEDRYELDYWSEIFERSYSCKEVITWWDYQWFFAALIRDALTVTPVQNLVSNVGFGPDASHTLNPDTAIHPALPLGPITHPSFVVRHRDADSYTYAHHYGGIRRRRLRTIKARLVRRWTRLLCWLGLR